MMDLDTLPNAREALVDRVERSIRLRTTGLIRNLKVEIHSEEIVVTGRAATYYAKQLATHAALEACNRLTLTNDIEVY
jgi:hypothetical protein